MQVHLSDLHLGPEERPETVCAMRNVTGYLSQHSGEVETLVFNGDAIAGVRQRDPAGNWVRIKDRLFEPLGDFLDGAGRGIDVVYLAGNCERQADPPEFGLGKRRPTGYTHSQNGVFTMHGHQLEPSLQTLAAETILCTLGRISKQTQRGIERILARNNLEIFDPKKSTALVSACIRNKLTVAGILEQQDMSTHQASCKVNEGIDGLLQRMPWLRAMKNHVVMSIIQDVYLRMYATTIGQLVRQGEMDVPKVLSFGHIHHPDCLHNKTELMNRFGLGGSYLPDFIVNTHTGAPLLEERGGTNTSNFAVIGDDGVPELWQSFDPRNPKRPAFLVNRGSN